MLLEMVQLGLPLWHRLDRLGCGAQLHPELKRCPGCLGPSLLYSMCLTASLTSLLRQQHATLRPLVPSHSCNPNTAPKRHEAPSRSHSDVPNPNGATHLGGKPVKLHNITNHKLHHQLYKSYTINCTKLQLPQTTNQLLYKREKMQQHIDSVSQSHSWLDNPSLGSSTAGALLTTKRAATKEETQCGHKQDAADPTRADSS